MKIGDLIYDRLSEKSGLIFDEYVDSRYYEGKKVENKMFAVLYENGSCGAVWNEKNIVKINEEK